MTSLRLSTLFTGSRAKPWIAIQITPSLPSRTPLSPLSSFSPRTIKRSQSTLSHLPLSLRIPPNSWDSHMHIVDPVNPFHPLSPSAPYTPTHAHTLPDALAFEFATLGIRNLVFVQPSIYGYDNSYLLEGLRQLGPRRGRGVVCFDADAVTAHHRNDGNDILSSWHELGVRGVRLNLVSVPQQPSPSELARTLHKYAAAIRHLDWVLQLYVPMHTLPTLLPIIPELGVKVCLDHFGNPQLPPASSEPVDPYSLPGFPALLDLLHQGSTYVKISAPYRLSKDPELRDLGAVGREILQAGKERVVFATDWPHTRFEGLDIGPFVEACLRWCEELGEGEGEEMAERLFRKNTEALWDVD
ncbi:hypothetical protein AJ79_07543 [Helicocarpus griseus UAMH5409]|uniref:Amidohydrolase-related domain-containing protein n=1 Tax=Helicocarpus griseus UAMH5409 TaxID=1447875 RepID=A0A2B7X261_9EURO|nr:hypothetical protein AJ79_07543 [Helicocarpus griseus UAMH5409]